MNLFASYVKSIQFTVTGIVAALVLAASVEVHAASDESYSPMRRSSNEGKVPTPYETLREHIVGRIALSVTNMGIIGSQSGSLTDPCTGLPAASLDFPRGSGVEYLFQSALWIGAVKDRDSLVSVGQDGWGPQREMFPDSYPDGDITERTTRPVLRREPTSTCPDLFYSADAISEQDEIAHYSDSLPESVDPVLVGSHVPLPIAVTQKSFSWSVPGADKLIIVEFTVQNIGTQDLSGVYPSLYVDGDVGHYSLGEIYRDDMGGFIPACASPVRGAPEDSIGLAWVADNDGDPHGGVFDFASATGALGVRFLPDSYAGPSSQYNWWVSDGSIARDWGPVLQTSQVPFPEGNLGTPVRDVAKYAMMGNGERDYDQVYAAIDHSADGWLPPPLNPAVAVDIADGGDNRLMINRGAISLPAGAQLTFPVAFLVGTNLHTDPANFAVNFSASDPALFMAGLDFTDLTRTAQLAAWIYDTPGIDTDGDGYRGAYVVHDLDTTFFRGDGIPDYLPPEPPEVPLLDVASLANFIHIRFNGERTETHPDQLTGVRDFEGYAIYLSSTGLDPANFALMARRDLVNFSPHRWDFDSGSWLHDRLPLTLDSLRRLYDSLCIADYGFAFSPDSFATAEIGQAFRSILPYKGNPSLSDTNYYYFTPFGPNETPDDDSLHVADSMGLSVANVIRKVYPYADPMDVLYRHDGTPFKPYYEYEYRLDARLLENISYLTLAVQDQGFPRLGIEPLETPVPGRVITLWLSSCPVKVTGDVNQSGAISLADIVYLVNYLFKGGVEPVPCAAAADCNCDGEITIVDLIVEINYLWKAGPEPCDVCALIPAVWECP